MPPGFIGTVDEQVVAAAVLVDEVQRSGSSLFGLRHEGSTRVLTVFPGDQSGLGASELAVIAGSTEHSLPPRQDLGPAPRAWHCAPQSRALSLNRAHFTYCARHFAHFAMDIPLGNRLIELRGRIVANFDAGNWEELGLLTGHSDRINQHPRLLRSLSWGDEDYAGNVLTVLRSMVESDPRTLHVIESYLDRNFPGESTYISAKPAERRVTFAPHVFDLPDADVELDLVAVLMPFAMEFDRVYASIKRAANRCGLRSLRADDIWEDTTIVQDIFSLIFRAQVVVVDFTGRNPNVMYETGIAHTLGKHVIPISQSLEDVPFDMRHHRVLKYLSNGEGIESLALNLQKKLRQFSPSSAQPLGDDDDEDDLPL